MRREAKIKAKIGSVTTAHYTAQQFEGMGNPLMWSLKAQELHCAALLLVPHMLTTLHRITAGIQAVFDGDFDRPRGEAEVHGPFFLLAAFSVENSLKGLIIRANPTLLAGGSLPGFLGKHDLLALAARAGVTLDAEETEFCVLATSASTRWGRYPVARTAADTVSGWTANIPSAVHAFDRGLHRLRRGAKPHPTARH